MNRKEYLSALKNELLSLTNDEQAEALQYYADYFEEADNDEKVIEELGSPEELGKTITEKFANAVVATEKSNNEENHQDQYEESKLFYNFDSKKIKNLDFNFGMAEVVFISGKDFSIETRGLSKDDLFCNLSNSGTLSVKNRKKIFFNFLSHERTKRFYPRILISIPEKIKLNTFNIKVGAGDFRCKNTEIYCNVGNIEVGAGNLIVKNIYGGEVNFRCGMGNLEYTGSVTGKSNIDCGMGELKLFLHGDLEDYSYDLKLGLGDFKINNQKNGGFYKSIYNSKKENHFSVNCGMGSVGIYIE